ncbi:hypothetical protein [Ammoniphilus oxalaticus]|nr:hypothetical protein [Ammoniphilus oxalaticus]
MSRRADVAGAKVESPVTGRKNGCVQRLSNVTVPATLTDRI